jgi:hypothetical protein
MVVGGLPGHGDGREVGERREEVEGEDGPGREINRLQLMQHWQRWWGAREREGGDLGGAWRGGERRRVIYCCGEAVEWPGSSTRTTCGWRRQWRLSGSVWPKLRHW